MWALPNASLLSGRNFCVLVFQGPQTLFRQKWNYIPPTAANRVFYKIILRKKKPKYTGKRLKWGNLLYKCPINDGNYKTKCPNVNQDKLMSSADSVAESALQLGLLTMLPGLVGWKLHLCSPGTAVTFIGSCPSPTHNTLQHWARLMTEGQYRHCHTGPAFLTGPQLCIRAVSTVQDPWLSWRTHGWDGNACAFPLTAINCSYHLWQYWLDMKGSRLFINFPPPRKGRGLTSGGNDAHVAARNHARWAVKANRNSQLIKPLLLLWEQWLVTQDPDTVPLC